MQNTWTLIQVLVLVADLELEWTFSERDIEDSTTPQKLERRDNLK